MTLEDRLKRLEKRAVPVEGRAFEVHFHEGAAIGNPREFCERCKAMTDGEYRAWLADKSGRVRVIEVRCAEEASTGCPR